jgi:hypothetical protein
MDNLVHFAFNVTLGKFYANMFVATLNQRTRTRAAMNTFTNGPEFDSQFGALSTDSGMPGGRGGRNHKHGGVATKRPRSMFPSFAKGLTSGGAMGVHITTTKEIEHDTPPTPLTPLDHLNKFRTPKTTGSVDGDDDMGIEKVRLDDVESGSSGHGDEKAALPHFTTAGQP